MDATAALIDALRAALPTIDVEALAATIQALVRSERATIGGNAASLTRALDHLLAQRPNDLHVLRWHRRGPQGTPRWDTAPPRGGDVPDDARLRGWMRGLILALMAAFLLLSGCGAAPHAPIIGTWALVMTETGDPPPAPSRITFLPHGVVIRNDGGPDLLGTYRLLGDGRPILAAGTRVTLEVVDDRTGQSTRWDMVREGDVLTITLPGRQHDLVLKRIAVK